MRAIGRLSFSPLVSNEIRKQCAQQSSFFLIVRGQIYGLKALEAGARDAFFRVARM